VGIITHKSMGLNNPFELARAKACRIALFLILIEFLLVVSICWLAEKNPFIITKTKISGLNSIIRSIGAKGGEIPPDLNRLVSKYPEYFNKPANDAIVDAWGNQMRLRAVFVTNAQGRPEKVYDVVSPGPDGIFDSPDDVATHYR